jgi:hypothetical protein
LDDKVDELAGGVKDDIQVSKLCVSGNDCWVEGKGSASKYLSP